MATTANTTTAKTTGFDSMKPVDGAIAAPATAVTPLSVKLANMLSAAKHGDRYVVAGRKTPVIAGILVVYNTSVYDGKTGSYFDIVAAKPLSGGRAIVLGQMSDRGLELCTAVTPTAEIIAAVGRANSAWAEILKTESKQTRLNLKLDALRDYFQNDANGAFVDL